MTSVRLLCLYCLLLTTLYVKAEDKVIRFQHLGTENGLPKNTIDCCIQDKYGFIWIATLDGLCRFDGYKISLYSGDIKDEHAPLNNRPTALVKDVNGQLWISFSGLTEKCRYNYETDDFTRFRYDQLSEQLNIFLYRRRHDSIRIAETNDFKWSALSNVLIQTNKKDGSNYIYPANLNSPFGLKDNFVLSVYRDEQNVLWVGTDQGGVHFGDIAQPSFKSYTLEAVAGNTSKDQTIRAIEQTDDGLIWLGTQKCGLICWDRKSNTTKQFVHQEKQINSLVENQVRSLCADRYGYLWIGTKGGLDRYDPRSNSFQHYTNSSVHKIPDNWVFTIMEDADGILWVGTWRGIVRYNREKDTFGWYDAEKSLMDPNVRVILEDKKKNLWVGTEGGGFTKLMRQIKSNKRGVKSKQFTRDRFSKNTLNDDYVYCMCEDADGMLWIGTGRGLNRFNPINQEFIRFDKNKNLSDKMITGLLYENGRIWASHRSGLTRITCKTLETRDFTVNDGLMGNELSENACFVDRTTSEVFFGGNNSLNLFFPKDIIENPYPPKVVLTNLQISNINVIPNQPINDHVILKKPLYLTKKIVLNWTEKDLLIEFAALHFSNPSKNQYAYFLKGIDKDWIYTDAGNRIASYSNMPSGTYLFMVKAANKDGVWNMNPTKLEIVILPPWWKTWWAYSLYILTVVLLLFVFFKMLLAREKLNNQLEIERIKAEKMQELEELKTNFFTSISHEFRTSLTLIIGPIEKLIKTSQKNTKESAYYQLIHRNAERLLQLINELLDLNKLESGNFKLNITKQDFVGYLKNMVGAFELLALDRQIRLHFESSIKEIQTGFDMAKMDKIMLNLLSNAFKYTLDGGQIDVRLDLLIQEGNLLCVQVSDSGIGIPAKDIEKVFDAYYQVDSNERLNSSGIGLALVKELVILHGGQIYVNSTLGSGSIFTFKIPLMEDAFYSMIEIDGSQTEVENNQQDGSMVFVSEDTPDKSQHIVLIVEDNLDVRTFLVNELKEYFHIAQAENGKTGLEMAFALIPDLVVSDIMMPKMNGLDLCEKLKRDERTSHIPVILLTALQSESSKITGFEIGADAYIYKPFNPITLKARIDNLIESRKRLRSLFNKNTGYDVREIAINRVDRLFMDRLVQVIEENLENPALDVEELSRMMRMSRTQMYRKIKAMTDKTSFEFVSAIRFKKAAEWLLSGEFTITEISDKLGFSEPGNFSRSFSREFGQSPKKYSSSFTKK